MFGIQGHLVQISCTVSRYDPKNCGGTQKNESWKPGLNVMWTLIGEQGSLSSKLRSCVKLKAMIGCCYVSCCSREWKVTLHLGHAGLRCWWNFCSDVSKTHSSLNSFCTLSCMKHGAGRPHRPLLHPFPLFSSSTRLGEKWGLPFSCLLLPWLHSTTWLKWCCCSWEREHLRLKSSTTNSLLHNDSAAELQTRLDKPAERRTRFHQQILFYLPCNCGLLPQSFIYLSQIQSSLLNWG